MATEVVLPRLCTRWAPRARPTASRGSDAAAARRCKAVSSLLALQGCQLAAGAAVPLHGLPHHTVSVLPHPLSHTMLQPFTLAVRTILWLACVSI